MLPTSVVILVMIITGVVAAAVPGGGDITFKAQNAKTVVFSHDNHVNVKELKCSACHNHLFQMYRDDQKFDMTKLTKGQFCGYCHNGERAFDVKDKINCEKCHK